jgi:hypothetical protein
MQRRLDDPLSTEPSVVQTSNIEHRPVAQCGARALPCCKNAVSRGRLEVTKRDTPKSHHVDKQRRKKKQQNLAHVHSLREKRWF